MVGVVSTWCKTISADEPSRTPMQESQRKEEGGLSEENREDDDGETAPVSDSVPVRPNVKGFVGEEKDFKLNSGFCRQPVQRSQYGRNMSSSTGSC